MLSWISRQRLLTIAACSFAFGVCSGLIDGFCGAPCRAQEPRSKQPLQLNENKATMLFVAAEDVSLRSGPSEDYYPTSKIALGESVEAHLRTETGWIGVRPPKGSFSWVPAKDAYLLPGGRVIEITEPAAVSWIGTEMGSAKQYRWQVELKPGEQLAVLGEATTQTDGRDALWYKIAPPSGEFRWIHESALSDKPVASEPERIAMTNAKPLSKSNPTTAPNLADSDTAAEQSQNGTKAGAVNAKEDAAVRTASFQDDIFGEAPSLSPSGPIQGGGPMSDSLPQGEVIYEDGGVYSENVIYEGDLHPGHAQSADPWAGWHVWELGDDGMRFTLLERLKRSRGTVDDPLKDDPFSLAMAKSNSTGPGPTLAPRATGAYRGGGSSIPTTSRRDRPWRDPRTLGRDGNEGAIQYDPYLTSNERASDRSHLGGMPRGGAGEGAGKETGERTPKSIIASIRENVDALGKPFRSSLDDRNASYQPTANSPNANLPNAGLDLNRRAADYTSSSSEEGGYRDDSRFEPNPVPERGSQPLQPTSGVNWYGINPQQAMREVGARIPASMVSTVGSQLVATAAAQELHTLQVALSDMVSKPPSTWQLEPIIERTKYLIEHGSNPVERGQARLLLERIDEFKNHASRTAFTAGSSLLSTNGSGLGSPSGSSVGVATASYLQPTSPANDSSSGSSMTPGKQPYDASGWLVAVHSLQPGQPSTALTDDRGNIVAYVTALPGMNLSMYLNEPVGIIGLRGYLPQLQAGYIEAQRVVRLR